MRIHSNHNQINARIGGDAWIHELQSCGIAELWKSAGCGITCHRKRIQHRLCSSEVPTRGDSRRGQPDQIGRNCRWPLQPLPHSKSFVPFVYQRMRSATLRNAMTLQAARTGSHPPDPRADALDGVL